MDKYIGALDLGTTSNRFIIFDHQGQIKGLDQKEHEQIYPKPGWVEHDPMEIWRNTEAVIRGALGKTGISGNNLAAVGITNQRETTVVWDKKSGQPFVILPTKQLTGHSSLSKNKSQQVYSTSGFNNFYSVILMGYYFFPIFAQEFKCQFKPIEIR